MYQYRLLLRLQAPPLTDDVSNWGKKSFDLPFEEEMSVFIGNLRSEYVGLDGVLSFIEDENSATDSASILGATKPLVERGKIDGIGFLGLRTVVVVYLSGRTEFLFPVGFCGAGLGLKTECC